MADWVLCCIYLGGVFSNWDKKHGFLDRIFWPVLFGEALYIWVRARLEN